MSPASPPAPRPQVVSLSGAQRLQVVDALLVVLDGVYAHLPQKRAGYAGDPVQALRLLRRRCVEQSDEEFHRSVTGLLTGLRDGHTRYRGHRPSGPSSGDGENGAGAGQVAVLPFLAEQYVQDGEIRHLASKVAPTRATKRAGLVPGVRLLTWNGIPFGRAVDLHAQNEFGGHPGARRARALESLTIRPLDFGPPPDELWVHLGFEAPDGTLREVRLDWDFVAPGRGPVAVLRGSPGALRQGIDPASEQARRAKKQLFAPKAWQADRDDARAEQRRRTRRSASPYEVQYDAKGVVQQRFRDVVSARVVQTPHGPVGHLRLWSFDVDDDDAFLDEVGALLDAMPPSGLVVDLRGNPGGLIWAAERLLQLFVDTSVTPIRPTRFCFLASPMTRAMAASPFNRMELGPWAASLEAAVATGDLWSRPIPLTDPQWCNNLPRRYDGPVVAVTDATTYSSGDLFAAGWTDHEIGPLVSIGDATGAGGANVWTHVQVRDALLGTGLDLPALPPGIGFTVAIRRALRSGRMDGVPLEDLGVAGLPYAMTRSDLLDGNGDLLAFCAAQLAPVD